ncbi:MAG: hypothetical protein GWN01_05545 [Nitrosopumilaceae archaeon]|nr:hypothetical protein [Nitrosopumilaceae archaeon]NIU86812.1 hypothetical protein [Nitrosopumilaceae archaeon]NIX61009.1 hypothetical protein [Nitrosopumilaceae archaeon]
MKLVILFLLALVPVMPMASGELIHHEKYIFNDFILDVLVVDDPEDSVCEESCLVIVNENYIVAFVVIDNGEQEQGEGNKA